MSKYIQKAVGFGKPFVSVPQLAEQFSSAPTTSDTNFPLGFTWIYANGDNRTVYVFGGTDSSGDAIWSIASPGSSDVDTLTGDSGGALSPSGGNITLAGGNSITTSGSGSTITFALDAAATCSTSVTTPLVTPGAGNDFQITAASGQDIILKMGDAAGSNKVSFIDSADAEVWAVDSNGGVSFTAITVTDLTATGTTQILGNNSSASTVTIASGAGGNTVSINNGINTSANVINLASGAAGANSTVNILNGNATTGTLTCNIFGSTAATTAGAVNIGTGAAAHTLTVGSASAGAISFDTAAGISLDAATASNFTVTGASADLTLSSSGGSVNITASESAGDAIVLNASDGDGGVQIQAGTAGVLIGNQTDIATLDLGNAAPAAARTITVGGGTVAAASVTDTIDIGPDGASTNADSVKTVTINNGGVETGQLLTNISSGAITSGTVTTGIVAGAITAGTVTLNMLSGNVAAGTVEANLLTGTGTKTLNIGNSTGTTTNIDGPILLNDSVNSDVSICTGTSSGTVAIGNSACTTITADAVGAISLDSAASSNFTVTGASADLTLSSSGGSVNITATEAVADAIVVTSSGGLDFAITGAAGKDIDMTCTSGSINITAGESAADAIVIDASGAAGAIQLNSGTGGLVMGSGQTVNVTAVSSAATPYAVLGSDYLIGTTTSGGVLTITLPASPATGRKIIVADVSGNAGANNVTVSGNGKNISAGGTTAATKLIDSNYGTLTLVYTGTIWTGLDVA